MGSSIVGLLAYFTLTIAVLISGPERAGVENWNRWEEAAALMRLGV